MESQVFRPGQAFLMSTNPATAWRVIFEDEGPAGYFYACDPAAPGAPDTASSVPEAAILDAMLIYNAGMLENPEADRLLAIEWSRDGQRAVLYLDGTAQAIADFSARRGFCRTNFPNFLEERGQRWNRTSHAWDEALLEEFEAALYGGDGSQKALES